MDLVHFKCARANGLPYLRNTSLQPASEEPASEEPTSEELSQWAIPDYSPLQLLACYDDFSDGLVQALAVSPDGTKFAIGGLRLTIWNVAEAKPVIDLDRLDEFSAEMRSIPESVK